MCRNVAPYIRSGREIPQNPRLPRERARLLFANFPFTCKSSIKTAWFRRQRQVVSLWVESARILAMRARSRAIAVAFFSRFLEIVRYVRLGIGVLASIPIATFAAMTLRLAADSNLNEVWGLLSCPRSTACDCTTIAPLPAGPRPAPSLVKWMAGTPTLSVTLPLNRRPARPSV